MRLFAGTPYDQPPKCDRCGALATECVCPRPLATRIPPILQTARLSVAKRQKGKIVTVIQGLPAIGNDLPKLLGQLKSHCGAGGTIDGEMLEIQGEHVERIRTALTALGYRVRG